MLRAGGLLDVLTPLPDSRQESVEKMERRIFRGFRICVGYISTTRFCVVGFMCPINIGLFCAYFVSLLSSSLSFPATTPRATTPHLYRTGYHAFTTTARLPRLSLSRLSRHSLILLLGYHTRAISLHHTRKSGYHTRHS